MTALIDQFGLASASTQFQANYVNGNLNQAFVDQTLAGLRRHRQRGRSAVQLPGAEADQQQGRPHLRLRDRRAVLPRRYRLRHRRRVHHGRRRHRLRHHRCRPTADQFALLGLSDTANVTLIYENYGFSARLAYNWRGTYLSNNSRGGSRNPVFVKDIRPARPQPQLRPQRARLVLVRGHQPDQVERGDLRPHREPAVVHRRRRSPLLPRSPVQVLTTLLRRKMRGKAVSTRRGLSLFRNPEFCDRAARIG